MRPAGAAAAGSVVASGSLTGQSLSRWPVSGATRYRGYVSPVARPRYASKGEPLPPPLPPVSRTVGQVVAEAIRLYQANVVGSSRPRSPGRGRRPADRRSLAHCTDRRAPRGLAGVQPRVCGRLGDAPGRSPAAPHVGRRSRGRGGHVPPGRVPLRLVRDRAPSSGSGSLATPCPRRWPSASAPSERSGAPSSSARADYVHAAGSFATLALLFGLTRLAMGLLLSSQADATVRVAIFLADVGDLAAPLPGRRDRLRRPGRPRGAEPGRAPPPAPGCAAVTAEYALIPEPERRRAQCRPT